MRRQAKKFAKDGPSDGSALILTVVLTSLLAIVGVLFIMMARVNQIASSGLSESKELNAAIETVIAKISEELVLDVPGVSATNPDYYDYPDANNAWLASFEPYDKSGVGYCWRHISDIDGTLGNKANDLETEIIDDYQNPSELEDSNTYSADADGDGVSDSKWVELADVTSSRGRPIYAAIRIIDNGGMLNVNTAYQFDPNGSREEVDGSSQMQINLMALSWRLGTTVYEAGDKTNLLEARAGGEDPNNLAGYETDVIWQYGNPAGLYTPFDISDELELRNRFLLNHEDIDTRLEPWGGEFRNNWVSSTPFKDTDEWFVSAYDDGSLDPNYAYRHLATTYNMDRIIDPNGEKMFNINAATAANKNIVYNTIRKALTDNDPNFTDVNDVAAQIAVNLRDFRDNDSNVTTFLGDTPYYGFEQPCIYISELACRLKQDSVDPGKYYRSYAVELYKPYSGDDNPDPNWQLVISNPDSTTSINWSGASQYHVVKWEDPCVPLDVNGTSSIQEYGNPDANLIFDVGSVISLTRRVGSVDVVVDSNVVPNGWLAKDGIAHSVQRDITLHKCIRRLWASAAEANTPTLGAYNSYLSGEPNVIQAHPANTGFTNIGEIGMVFRKPAYYEVGQDPYLLGVIGYSSDSDTEEEVRIDLAESEFQQIFNYLTVWPPSAYVTDPNEARIKGRININTAPWFVLAQLPWMQYQDSNSIPFERAKAISDYRDEPSQQGFWNIGELMLVNEMLTLGEDDLDQVGFPDLTWSDGAVDDFEERDVIFSRISNLVTVRSDVFTAYILVRIGTDGPQKRVIAILDRSDVYSPTDRVKIVAVHPVADPR